MGIIEDVMKALDRIPAWKRLNALPAEVEELRSRVASLEARLAPARGTICPKCRQPQLMFEDWKKDPGPFGAVGRRLYVYRCQACSYADERDSPL